MKFYRLAVISGDNGDARSSGRKGRLVFDMLSAIVLTVVLVLVCITFQDYGISWDEEIQNTYGKKILSYYLSGLEDQSVFKHFNLYLYGGSFDLVAAIVNTVFGVIVGTIMLIVCLVRAYKGDFTPRQHFGFEAAAWYWHFVDVVWLFLFAAIYIWGR